jgi:O-antigen ligase
MGIARPEGTMAATPSVYTQPDPLLRGSFPLLQIFLFAVFSAIMEVIPVIGKIRPQLILAIFGLLAVFATGQFMKVLNTRIGMSVAVFTAWFIAAIPFGAWPGGSFHVLIEQWYKAALIFMMTAGLLTTLPQANRVFKTIAWAASILSIFVLLKNNRTSDGRLVLDNTRYANANALAWTLLVGLTFVGFMFLRGSRWQKALAVVMAAPMLLAISRTGSRAGAMGAVILFFITVFQSKASTRNRILALSPVLALVILVLMPREIRLRYTTYFGSYDPYNVSAEEKLRIGTIGSTESRKQLLLDSLNVTAHHPLLGVGPGNFQVAQNDIATERGDVKGMWHVTHNTYTELSSEMGIPGLVIYLVMLYYIFRTLNSIIRNRTPGRAWNELRALALSLRTAFFIFLPIAFFDSLSYNADVPILAGLATALGFIAQKQRTIDRLTTAQDAVERMTPADSQLEPVAVGTY